MLRGGAGSSNSEGIVFGGSVDPPVTANTEQWDGSSWTEVANLSTARYGPGGTSASTASQIALASGGHPNRLTATEEWTVSHTLKKVTTS